MSILYLYESHFYCFLNYILVLLDLSFSIKFLILLIIYLKLIFLHLSFSSLSLIMLSGVTTHSCIKFLCIKLLLITEFLPYFHFLVYYSELFVAYVLILLIFCILISDTFDILESSVI